MAKRKKPQRIIPDPRPRRSFLGERSMEWLCVSLILIAASILLLMNLGNQYLWQDEAQTACIAKTILTHGVPLGTDGKNFFSQEIGAEYGKNYIWRWHTWLPFYVLAGFFKLFGTSTLVCRLPYALFGIGAILMGYYLGKSLWRSRRAGVLTAILLLLSVPFLIVLKQCRFYSMVVFFTMTGLHTYLGMIEGRKRSDWWFGLSCLMLFHTHYMYYGALMLAAAVHVAIFHRDRLKPVLIVSAIVFALNLPWIVWLAGASFEASISYKEKALWEGGDKLAQLGKQSWTYVRLIGAHIFPPFLLAIPTITVMVSWIRRRRFPRANPDMAGRVALVLIFVVSSVLACAVLSPYPHFRYLVTLLPIMWLLTAYMIEGLMKLHWSLGIAVLALLLFAGTTRAYLYEITHDYDGPIEGTVQYLNEHGSDDDVVVALHEEMPLKFYTKMRVLGGLTGEDLSPGKSPKWIVLRKPMGKEEDKVLQFLQSDFVSDKYELIELTGYPDITFENREEPGQHQFWTAEDTPPVRLMERVRD